MSLRKMPNTNYSTIYNFSFYQTQTSQFVSPLPPTAAAAARLPFHPPPSKGNLAKPPERRMSRSFDERNSRDILARPVHPLSAVSASVVEREVGAEE